MTGEMLTRYPRGINVQLKSNFPVDNGPRQ